MIFSKNLQQVFSFAKILAESTKETVINPEELINGILLTPNCVAYEILSNFWDCDDAAKTIRNEIKRIATSDVKKSSGNVKTSVFTERIMVEMQQEAKMVDSELTRTEHLLLGLAKFGQLESISYEDIKNIINDFQKNDEEYYATDGGDGDNKKTKSKSKTPFLDEFTIDITEQAKQGKLDPVVGRKNELKRIAQVLSRRKKNNPVLIGKEGTGKSTVVYGLAQNIVNRDVPDTLFNKKLLSLDVATLVAGTKYRGDFEERMKKIVEELKCSDDVILYIDEIHTLVGAGSTSGSLDAANILKPALANGEISCIGATTFDEYRNIEKDGALARRFQKIVVNEPSIDETRIIMNNIKSKYEEYHNVTYTEDAIEACIKLSDRYITDRYFPDKAIDALDEAGSAMRITSETPNEILELNNKLDNIIKSKNEKVKEQDFEGAAKEKAKQNLIKEKIDKFYQERNKNVEKMVVTAENVAETISIMTGIPSSNISQDDTSKYLNLATNIKKTVVGQDEAVDKIVRSVMRNKAGFGDTKRPIGSFMFLGSTGCGKTFLTKSLAAALFTSEKDMIRIDMSEYMEKHSTSRLIGSPPGYVGYDEAGQLTEAVRRNPYSIILFDEIEKAHPDVCNLLLQILDDGQLTDSKGKTVDFKNTVIIMTSNVGSREAKSRGAGIGFNTSKTELNHTIVDKALKDKFAPEFLNRIDEIINFNVLTEENIKSIINLELNKFISRVNDNGLDLVFDNSTREFLFSKGWDEELGARPLKRAIQKYVEDEISILYMTGIVKVGYTIKVSKNPEKDELKFDVKKPTIQKIKVKKYKVEKD